RHLDSMKYNSVPSAALGTNGLGLASCEPSSNSSFFGSSRHPSRGSSSSVKWAWTRDAVLGATCIGLRNGGLRSLVLTSALRQTARLPTQLIFLPRMSYRGTFTTWPSLGKV